MSLAIARYPSLTASSAFVAQASGRLAVPVLVISTLVHRFDLIDSPTLFVLLAVVALLALTALIAALVAFLHIWRDGALGLPAAGFGLAMALLALAPAGFACYSLVTLPRLYQISTDLADPPFFRRTETRTPRMNALTPPTPAEATRQRVAYPDILTRRYPLLVSQLDIAALRTVERMGWRLAGHYSPVNDRDRGRLEAVARTLVFGFRDDVAIRVMPDPAGARIDLRSVSRFGRHDLGTNAARIREFHRTLDQVILELYPQ